MIKYGHVMGDKGLKLVCKALKAGLRGYEYKLFRYGGDEFFVIVEKADYKDAEVLIKNIQKQLAILNIEHINSKISNQVTLTIGATVIEKLISDYTEIFTSADEALYAAKAEGRNREKINRIL